MKLSENVGMKLSKLAIYCNFYSHGPISHKFTFKMDENFLENQ